MSVTTRWCFRRAFHGITTLALGFLSIAAIGSIFKDRRADVDHFLSSVEEQDGWPFLTGKDIAEHESLVQYVKNHVLMPPSGLEYNLSNPQLEDPSEVQVMSREVIPKFLQGVSDFYISCFLLLVLDKVLLYRPGT
jgi:hypothetical protein